MKKFDFQKGFTLVEILIVLALIAILVGVVLVTLNPGRQFAAARNSARYSHLNTLMNAISANAAENNGVFTCASGALPTTATVLANTGGYDIAPCLVPNYLPSLPVDPSGGTAQWTSTTNYNAGYTIFEDVANNRITVDAGSAELDNTISVIR